MSNATFILVTLSLQALMAVLALAGGFALSREYLRRKQAHLAAYATGFFFLCLAYVSSLGGQIISAFGGSVLSTTMINGFQHLLAVAMYALSLGFILAYSPRKYRTGLVVALSAAAAYSLFDLFFLSSQLFSLKYGYNLPSITWGGFQIHFLTSVIATVLHLSVFFLRPRGEKLQSAEKAVGLAGLLLLAAYVGRALTVLWDQHYLVPFNTGLQLLAIIPLFLGVNARHNPDTSIAARPTMYVKKRLLYKATLFNALLFWFLSFFLVLVTSSYFIATSVQSMRVGLRKDVHYFSKSFAASGVRFLQETETLSLLPAMPSVMGSDIGALPPAARAFIDAGDNTRILRVVDQEGKVVFSSYSQSEVGTIFDSKVMRKALSGRKSAAAEHEGAARMWSLRAAVPLIFEDSSVGGVILATDISVSLDFSDYTSIAPISASGYGYISPTDETAFSMGVPVDELMKSKMKHGLSVVPSASVSLPDSNDEVFVEKTFSPDGDSDGYFYAILGDALVTSYVFRVISIVTLVMLLSLGIVIIILLFAMSMTLRPIKELRQAASRVARDEYDVHVRYENPDEVGELASAFNRMSGAIGDRTDRLKQALREQRDFLEHSILDIRTPVNVFRWTLELMRFGDTGQLTRQQLEFIEQMNQTNERLSRLLQNLQDVVNLDSGKLVLKSQKFSMEEAVDEVAGENAVQIREKGLALHWKRPAKPIGDVVGDRAYTKKILGNLICNAVKFNQANGHIEVSLDRTSGGRGKPDFVVVTVEDGGRGISAADKPYIFSRFFRNKEVVRSEMEGSGLGLFISKRLAELQGGAMWFESQDGKGSSFHFSIPVDDKR